MFIDIDCSQLKKYNQNAYGDYILSNRFPESGRLIAVLSDGLGSGIKANILSCMTATMLLRFIEEQVNIKKAAEIIMNALPVCKVRKISYSTFSAVDCNEEGEIKIVEEGNPDFIWIRRNDIIEPPYEEVQSKTFKNRKMKVYKFKLEKEDRLIMCSDGVTQSGLGNPRHRLGLRREGLINILKDKLAKNPSISSRELSKYIIDQARLLEENREAKDDISALVIYFRKPRESIVFTGPPYHKEKDSNYAKNFEEFNGKKAICGGTTANILSRELNTPIESESVISVGQLPSCSRMKNIDLVTEGILTLTKASEYLDDKIPKLEDAAVKLVKFFLDSDCINFLVGAKLNNAHYDPNLPIEIEIRKNIIKKIAKTLETKYFKKVSVQYI